MVPSREPSGEQGRHAGSAPDQASVSAAAARRTLSYKEVFWLATMGGAQALGLQVSMWCLLLVQSGA